MALRPRLTLADDSGRIHVHPRLLMAGSRCGETALPQAGELLPLPAESEIFLMPGRQALGYDARSGKLEAADGLAVAAFAAPGHTLSAHPLCVAGSDAPALPLFAYGAVGFARGKFWIWASKVDNDRRQVFSDVPDAAISAGARRLLREYPDNRLVAHIINNCVFRYDCPAARNFALGRHEAPLPSSRACNAHCLGCISKSQPLSPVAQTPQCRLDFTPSAAELCEVMAIHASREKTRPIFSFGQGCEGDPLLNAPLLAESIRLFRMHGGKGTVNCNSNASMPEALPMLAEAGLTSLRISLNSVRPELYEAYYNPEGYAFEQVEESARLARRLGLFVSLNLLWFPGITDSVAELEALSTFCGRNGVSMIQWRNLNIDPQWFYERMRATCPSLALGPANAPMGLAAFMDALRKRCPWLRYGYFNPWLGEKAALSAPEASA